MAAHTASNVAVMRSASSCRVHRSRLRCFEKQGGQSAIDPATYFYYIHARPSQPSQAVWLPFDDTARRRLIEDFHALWDTHFLDSLSIEAVDYVFANGVVGKVIRFDIEEKLRSDRIPIRADTFVDAGDVRRAEGVIRQLLADDGYLDGAVTHRLTPLPGQPRLVRLTFVNADGPKYVVDDIDFVSNAAFSDRTLGGQMEHVKAGGLFSFSTGRGTYHRDRFEEDAERVTAFYRDHGYLQAHVDNPEVRVLDGDGRTRRVRLRIHVTEGPRYRLGSLTLAGNRAVKSEALRPLFKLATGDVLSEKRLRKGLEQARELYGGLGYFEFTAYPDYQFSDPARPEAARERGRAKDRAVAGAGRPPTMDVTVRVQEGEQYFVRRITFVGNTTTKDEGGFLNGSYATTNFLGQGETVRLTGLMGARSNDFEVGVVSRDELMTLVCQRRASPFSVSSTCTWPTSGRSWAPGGYSSAASAGSATCWASARPIGDLDDRGEGSGRLADPGDVSGSYRSPSALATALSTCGTRNGFTRYPTTPRLTAWMALASVEYPVMMITRCDGCSLRASRMSESPSMPGMRRSAIRRS